MVVKKIDSVKEIKQYIISVDGQEHIFKTIQQIEQFFNVSHGTAFNILKGRKKTINIKNKSDGKPKLRNQ